jgi:2-polyprenyl-3-methyl-5-hydroxy-6-metoxy-1,4-benzoquinol methylase
MRGYNVSGVEMSKHAVEIAEKKGLKVYEGDLMSLNLKDDSFDVVTMLDVLEHMTDPLGISFILSRQSPFINQTFSVL